MKDKSVTDTVGLIIQGNDRNNVLYPEFPIDDNGNTSIYNIIHAGAGNDQLTGWPSWNDEILQQYGTQLFGEDGDDYIADSVGDDTLSGGDGHDIISSRLGNDIIDGGDGNDSLLLWRNEVFTIDQMSISGIENLSITSAVRIGDFDLNQFDSVSGTIFIFTEQATIENVNFTKSTLDFRGSAFDDIFDVSNSAGTFTISGGAGDDEIVGGQSRNNLTGQNGDDILTGATAEDTIDGGHGNDIIFGGDGDDNIQDSSGSNTIHGGEGNDLLILSGNNLIYGNGGNDTILAARSAIVSAGDGDDKIYLTTSKHGDAGKWTVRGGEGDDSLHAVGNLSNLQCHGVEQLFLDSSLNTTIDEDTLNGFDAIHVSVLAKITLLGGGDFVWKHVAGEQRDVVRLQGADKRDHIDLSSSTAEWIANGGSGDDVIIGARTDNVLTGGEGNDTITGGNANDTIQGNVGDDVLVTNSGYDKLWGGNGADTYVFSGGHGKTSIEDLNVEGGDKIDLSAASSIIDFHDLLTHHVFDFGSFVEIRLGRFDLELIDVKLSDLHESSFIF